MKVCFVGVGSIARRHIKNLIDICAERQIDLSVDALRRSSSSAVEGVEFSNVYTECEELPNDYDVIFITNPTDFHMDMLNALHNKSKHFFIEKPLTSLKKLADVKGFTCREDSVYYIACPLRYTSVIQYIKNNVNIDEVLSARCISSSYLPDWRPGIDYRKTYSADKELGGGVSIDLIHEWDYIKYILGMPETVSYVNGKVSNLELNCEDYAVYIASYKDKIVELHLDYFGRKTMREIMLFTERDTIVGDLTNSKVSYLKEGKVIEFGENRDDFQKNELRFFLDVIDGRVKNTNNMWDAYRTLKLTQGEVER